jgi:Tachylectin
MTSSDESGILYAIHDDGRLLFYRDQLRDGSNASDGSTGWAAGSGNQIGQHFEGIRQLVDGGGGILYAIHEDGRLLFYRDQLRDGSNAPDGSKGWASKSGEQIGQHFEGIRLLVGGGGGILYAIHQDGRLLFFRDILRDGSNSPDGSTGWAPGSGNQVGQHFEGIRELT